MASSPRRQLSFRRKMFRTGCVLALIGTLLWYWLLPSMWTSLFKSQLKLKRDSEIFKSWQQFPVPLTTKFHFFHVLNPEEAMNGAKVKLREVGPFTFDQWRRKEVIEWGPEDETIKYNEYKKYIYKPELSDDWDQEITTINPVVAGLASNIEDTMKSIPLVKKVISPFLYGIISGALIAHGHNLFLKTTPRQLLKGHRINIFDTASEIAEPFSVFGIKKEDLLPTEDLPNNAFGILNGKNNTPIGPFEMWTGLKDQSKYSYIFSYKNEKKMTKWSSEECNRIYGTDGAQYPPFRSKSDRLPIYTPDVCRTLYVIYDKEDEFKGIPVWKMKLDPKIFEPPRVNSDNECYCMHLKKKPERCSIRGTIDLGGCLKGAPLILSSPHFLGTQPNLAELVEGLNPDKKKHEFYLYFEPRIATPVFAYGRIQLSIRVERTSFLRGFDQVRNAFIPFVWIEESGGVDDTLATILRVILVYIVDGSQTLAFLVMIIGYFMAISTFTYGILCSSRRLDSEEHLYRSNSPSEKLRHIDSDRSSSEDDDEREDEDEETSSSTETTDKSNLKKIAVSTPVTISSSSGQREETARRLNSRQENAIVHKEHESGRQNRGKHHDKTRLYLTTSRFTPFYKRTMETSRSFVKRSTIDRANKSASFDTQDVEVGRSITSTTKTASSTIVTSSTTVASTSSDRTSKDKIIL